MTRSLHAPRYDAVRHRNDRSASAETSARHQPKWAFDITEIRTWNAGASLVAASTALFAIDFVIAKHLLRNLATLTVITARMTLGTAMLFVYVVLTGRLIPLTQLTESQWAFVVVTGVLLLLFTTATFTAIRRTSVSAVLAIGAAAPIVTTLLQVVGSGRAQFTLADLLGLAVTLLAAAAVIALGVRQDNRAARIQRPVGGQIV